MNLDHKADFGASPAPTSFNASHARIPSGIGIHFDPAAPANPAAPAASPAAPGAPAVPASPADGSAAASPAASPESPNIRQLREQYETVKGQLEPWQRLNVKPEDAAAQLPIIQRMRTEALELAEQLGYDAQEVQDFFAQDPVRVLSHLRQRAQSAQPQQLSPGDLKKQLDKLVEERMKPITQREDARLNDEATFRFDGEFDRLFKDNFKDGLPDDARDALYEMVAQLVGEDEAACRRLKFDRQTSDVAKYFDQAKARLLKVFAAWTEHERTRAGGERTPKPPVPGAPKSRLDAKLSTGQTVKELFNI